MIQGWCPSPAPDCLGSPGTLGGPAGCVLHVERSGAAQRRDADHPRDQRPVRPDWQPDVPGGNVLFEAVPSNPIDGGVLVRCAPSRGGVDQRPLDPARYEFVTGEDFYTAALDGRIKAR